MRFATYSGYVLQMIPSRPPVRLSRTPWVNNSTRATTQVPQAVDIRALTHPLKNLSTFSKGTVWRKMMNDDDFTGRIFKRIRSWCVILHRYTCFLKYDLKPDNLPKKSILRYIFMKYYLQGLNKPHFRFPCQMPKDYTWWGVKVALWSNFYPLIF